LDRDLTAEEITDCEESAKEYVHNDSYEIEIHNLNEVNEYFRIFKDEVVKNKNRYQSEITDLKMQVNMLKAKIEGAGVSHKLRLSYEDLTPPRRATAN
jgi:hypothetical protein